MLSFFPASLQVVQQEQHNLTPVASLQHSIEDIHKVHFIPEIFSAPIGNQEEPILLPPINLPDLDIEQKQAEEEDE